MDQFFNVQMNVQDAPKIQIEQSSNATIKSSDTGSEETFASVLQKTLPKDNTSKNQVTADTSLRQQTDQIKNQSPNDSIVNSTDEDFTSLNAQDVVTDIAVLIEQFSANSNEIDSANSNPLKGEQLQAIQQNLSDLINNAVKFNSDNGDSYATNTDGKSSNNQNQLPTDQDQVNFAAGTKNLSELQGITTSSSQNPVQTLLADPVIQQIFLATPQTITPEQESLFAKIQAIINSGAEAGVLSIKNVTPVDNGNSLRSQLMQLPPAQIQTLSSDDQSGVPFVNSEGFTALEDGIFAPTLRTKQQLSGIRHDSTQQFYDAKTQPLNALQEGSNLSGNQQGDQMGQSGSGFNQPTPQTVGPEATNTFSLTGAAATSSLSIPTPDTTSATLLPSGTLVQDTEVMQQLVERFQVNKRRLESKIQIKLHPVELGKMEIDLTVKEGSIRANVVAQSQHVQEILERNITKLKAVLEQQGFNVEEITITSESEMVGQFDLFDQHLSNKDSSKFLNQDEKSETPAPFVLDELQESFVESSSGVNVKV